MFPLSSMDEKEKLLAAQKRKFGLIYGAIAGLAFSLALWGYDGYLLARSHALFPWMKLIVGGILAVLLCGAAGWLTNKFLKPGLGLLFWSVASLGLGALTAYVPLRIAPFLSALFRSDLRPLLDYPLYDDLPYKIGTTAVWIFISAAILGILQVPLVEQAVFSISVFGVVAPNLLCAVLMMIAGSLADEVLNTPLREPVLVLDETIQFILDSRGVEVDPQTAREKHLAAFRDVQDIIEPARTLIVSGYDRWFETFPVIVDFDGQRVRCTIISGAVVNCASLAP